MIIWNLNFQCPKNEKKNTKIWNVLVNVVILNLIYGDDLHKSDEKLRDFFDPYLTKYFSLTPTLIHYIFGRYEWLNSSSNEKKIVSLRNWKRRKKNQNLVQKMIRFYCYVCSWLTCLILVLPNLRIIQRKKDFDSVEVRWEHLDELVLDRKSL